MFFFDVFMANAIKGSMRKQTHMMQGIRCPQQTIHMIFCLNAMQFTWHFYSVVHCLRRREREQVDASRNNRRKYYKQHPKIGKHRTWECQRIAKKAENCSTNTHNKPPKTKHSTRRYSQMFTIKLVNWNEQRKKRGEKDLPKHILFSVNLHSYHYQVQLENFCNSGNSV